VTAAAPHLLEHLRSRQDAMAALLAELARLESPSTDPESQQAPFARLSAALGEAGLACRRLAGPSGRRSGGQLLALGRRRPRGTPAQLLLGHIDTVWPTGSLAAMPVELRDGRLYGPGTYDMKGGLVQAVFALEALAELRLTPPARPVLFVSSDEEVGSAESVRRIERLARACCRVFVLEPSLGPEGKLKTARKGAGTFEVIVRGRASHAGLEPEKGASAIHELARLIGELTALTDLPRGISVNVGVISGGLRSNVVAPEATAQVDVRVLEAGDAERIERALADLRPSAEGLSIEVRGGMERGPLERTPGNRRLWAQAQAAAAELGLALDEGTAGGASDGNFTSRLAPTLDGLGAVGDGAHAVHEHVVVDRMPERAALLALLLLAPVDGEGGAR
jgi:glutamate carboxypeptidase